jgi:hypothetical protein
MQYVEMKKWRIYGFLLISPFLLYVVVLANNVFLDHILPKLKLLGMYWQFIPLPQFGSYQEVNDEHL